ncbi:NAD(P)H-dependent FMN reductase [Micromonospora phaseoli]|uniref:NAD(P)H-dependent FMN reductase n=1 Tax=Micromonospora phaseoli TaxID=1144548 RepID=A0A1H6SZ53_9ACTN|nr:NAD(P)H-dependent oxidoreductase [Micromonospora phaseoli]PZW04030.1 NAD(P)H-dependent FMN reductase [Micromonospora phaseoli]GIJ77556.1 FMN reductase [Micromonospora phaseoli]SEI69245.1 NAD(P)H-dependent FMN reductase [Micromonospora phaseoli]
MNNTQRNGPAVVGLVVGSSRPGRRGPAVAGWVAEVADRHPAVRSGEAAVELIDLAEQRLPLLDEPVPARFGEYRHDHTRRWSALVAACDAYVFVTPEYNHSVPAVLKNGIDYLDAEWRSKPAGVLSYGVTGGGRAAGHLRTILTEVGMTVVPEHVELGLFTDFDWSGEDRSDPTAAGRIAPGEGRAAMLTAMLTDLLDAARVVAPVAGR